MNVAVEALPEIVQCGGKGLQLSVNRLAQPRDVQGFERLRLLLNGDEFVAKTPAPNTVVEVQFADFETFTHLAIDPELVAVAAQRRWSAVRAAFQEVRTQSVGDAVLWNLAEGTLREPLLTSRATGLRQR